MTKNTPYFYPTSKSRYGNFPLNGKFWWGGRPWPLITSAGTEARPTEIFQFLWEPQVHERLPRKYASTRPTSSGVSTSRVSSPVSTTWMG